MGALPSSELSKVTQILIWLGLVVVAAFAIMNVFNDTVTRPHAFYIALIGFVLFATGKLSVILKKKKISFGPKLMTENMANLYRLGYWLMIVGLLSTFAPK